MDPKSPEMTAARQRLNDFDEDNLLCIKQESFTLLKSLIVDQVGTQAVDTVPGIAALPYSVGRQVVATLIETGLLLGARAYASATRDAAFELPLRPVPIYELFIAMRATSEAGEDEHQAFQAAVAPDGATTALMGELAIIVANDVVKLDERLEAAEEVLLGLAASFVERGAAAEFCFERLVARALDDAGMWNNALGFISGAPDMSKWAAKLPPADALRKVVQLAIDNGRIESGEQCTCALCKRSWISTPYDEAWSPGCECFAEAEAAALCPTCGEEHRATCSSQGEPLQ